MDEDLITTAERVLGPVKSGHMRLMSRLRWQSCKLKRRDMRRHGRIILKWSLRNSVGVWNEPAQRTAQKWAQGFIRRS